MIEKKIKDFKDCKSDRISDFSYFKYFAQTTIENEGQVATVCALLLKVGS